MPGSNEPDRPDTGFHEERARRIIEEYEPATYGVNPDELEELRERAEDRGFTGEHKRSSVHSPDTDGIDSGGRTRRRPRTTYLEIHCLRCTVVSEHPSQRSYDGISCPECGSIWIDIQRHSLADRDENRDS